jgi:hypothetical protein
MSIRTLSLPEFDRFRSARTVLARCLTDHAVEWFVDDARTVLGALAYDERVLDWSFVILGRDTQNGVRVFDRGVGINDRTQARRLLLEQMALAVPVVAQACTTANRRASLISGEPDASHDVL